MGRQPPNARKSLYIYIYIFPGCTKQNNPRIYFLLIHTMLCSLNAGAQGPPMESLRVRGAAGSAKAMCFCDMRRADLIPPSMDMHINLIIINKCNTTNTQCWVRKTSLRARHWSGSLNYITNQLESIEFLTPSRRQVIN